MTTPGRVLEGRSKADSSRALASEAFAEARYADALDLAREGARPNAASSLLEIQSLLRLGRADEALGRFEARTRRQWADTYPLAVATSGLALLNLGRLDEAVERLAEARRTVTEDTEPEVAADVAYSEAQGAWAVRDLTRAEELAAVIGPEQGLAHVRALDLLGFVAAARSDLATASRYHSLALVEYPRCGRRDELVYASLLCQASIFAFELLDGFLRAQVREHSARVRWTAAMSRYHTVVELYAGRLAMLDGGADAAGDAFERSIEAADGNPQRAMAMIDMSELERALDEPFAARRWYAKAKDSLAGVAWKASTPDERMALLSLCRAASEVGDMCGSAPLVRYLSVSRAKGKPSAFDADPRTEAFELKARAHVAVLQQKPNEARALFEEAHARFRRLRMRFRCVQIAAELARLGDGLFAPELSDFSSDFPRSLYAFSHAGEARANKPVATQTIDEPALGPAERRVYALLCEGRSASEIADELGKSRHTINNQTRRIFKRFNVRSRAALVADNVRRTRAVS